MSQSLHGDAQHLSFFLTALVKDQLLFTWGHLNFPYFALLKFILLTGLINIFLLTFCSHKTCYKSFAIPITYTGYDGCPTHHRFPQAKLIFPLYLPTKHQPLSSSRSPWNSHTLLSLLFDFSCRCFFFFIFSVPRNFKKGFVMTLQTLAEALYRFLGNWTIDYFLLWNTCLYFLLIIEDGVCNVTLRLVKHALLFPSGLLHYYHHDFCSHPLNNLSFTKKL